MMSADPIHVGATYSEDDSGSDVTPDRFEISFTGGAPGTQLKRLVIDGDQDGNGFDEDDVFFDTIASLTSRGVLQAHGPLFIAAGSDNVGQMTFNVIDGTTKLEILFEHFDAGEHIILTIDVDEAENFNPNETNMNVVNSGFDTLTSGVEFQDSTLTGYFEAPHYHPATGTDIFWNAYDDKFAGKGLELPADNSGGFVNRTAGAVVTIQQQPLPITIEGTVYKDPNLNNHQDGGETGISGVTLTLQRKDGANFVPTGLTATTDSQGRYRFDNPSITPGVYRIVETQPAAPLFSVGATAGRVGSSTRGTVETADVITEISLNGGENSVGNDFAEALPGSLSGYAFIDANDNGVRDSGEAGIGGVTIQLLDANGNPTGRTATTSTTPATLGYYIFTDVRPGTYGVAEIQPVLFDDGKDQVGSAGGTALAQPGDRITGVAIASEHDEVNYNFGELIPPGSISGYVHADPDQDCVFDAGETPLSGVVVELLDVNGNLIRTTTTDSAGKYEFLGLPPGQYAVRERQPAGYFQGGQVVGSGTGVIVGEDHIGQIQILSRVALVNYNFCELPPGNLSGNVFADRNQDCIFDSIELPIANVTIELLNAQGQIVRTTLTNSNGFYEFKDLAPGSYAVREIQPTGYFQGGQTLGSGGGTIVGQDHLGQIVLRPVVNLTDYNFCEWEPGRIAGLVYSDLDQDGAFDAGESPIANVTIELLDSQGSIIRTTQTDSVGRYEFTGLAPGTYGVHELQPAGYFQGGQTLGSGGGTIVGQDHLGQIVLKPANNLVEYNFYEWLPGSLRGSVFVDPDSDCLFDSGETPLSNVEIELVGSNGNVLRTTFTDGVGNYDFTGLTPGTYAVRQKAQPNGFFHGGQVVGSGGGVVVGQDHIGGIALKPNNALVHYDFCETPPATLSGWTYYDPNNNGQRESGEVGIGGVTVQLFDAQGVLVATQTSSTADANKGFYKFIGLRPGVYRVQEVQPAGYRDGLDMPGTAGGSALAPPGDRISGATLAPAQDAINYNFGERPLPGGITGVVYSDPDQDCVQDTSETPISGVRIELIDLATGGVLQTTFTDSSGRYTFTNVEPGPLYGIRETQPTTHFDGGMTRPFPVAPGVDEPNFFKQVTLPPGQTVGDYNYCEIPPAKISGYVFQDGAPILTLNGTLPASADSLKDGVLTPDDTRLGGITLRLAHGVSGESILGSATLPGKYNANQPITVKTDANGYYEFVGLPPGNYGVFETQPVNYIDSRDTQGTKGGKALNPSDPVPALILQQLSVPHGFDAILRIELPAGTDSANNNFSEVLTTRPTYIPPKELPPNPQPVVVSNPTLPPLTPINIPYLTYFRPDRLQSGASGGYTWHLSVIDAGFPRGVPSESTEDAAYLQGISERPEIGPFRPRDTNEAEWTLAISNDPNAATRKVRFGVRKGVPVPGDFNGDGIYELAVWDRGEWLIDLDGDGQWTEKDLWAKLGTADDKPVVGDWNGDGKQDIGIYGPAWAGDPNAVHKEPGVPHADNPNEGPTKNMPPRPEEATSGSRKLKLSSQGDIRSDVIDHVFHFGTTTDGPVTGDWRGNGVATIGIFRGGSWRLDIDGDGKWSGADLVFEFGQDGDKSVIGDWNGDGIDDLGVYRSGLFILDSNGNRRLDSDDRRIKLGGPHSQPAAGDWNGDGIDDVAVYDADHAATENVSAEPAAN